VRLHPNNSFFRKCHRNRIENTIAFQANHFDGITIFKCCLPKTALDCKAPYAHRKFLYRIACITRGLRTIFCSWALASICWRASFASICVPWPLARMSVDSRMPRPARSAVACSVFSSSPKPTGFRRSLSLCWRKTPRLSSPCPDGRRRGAASRCAAGRHCRRRQVDCMRRRRPGCLPSPAISNRTTPPGARARPLRQGTRRARSRWRRRRLARPSCTARRSCRRRCIRRHIRI